MKRQLKGIIEKRMGMFVPIPKTVLFDATLSDSEKIVYAALSAHLNSNYPNLCFPSVKVLARLLGNGVSTIKRATNALEKHGLIIKEHRIGTSTIFHLPPPVELYQEPERQEDFERSMEHRGLEKYIFGIVGETDDLA